MNLENATFRTWVKAFIGLLLLYFFIAYMVA